MRVYKYIILYIISVTSIYAGIFTTDYSTVVIETDKSMTKKQDTLFVNFKLQHKDNWHSYWKNPGDSGLATTVNWDLPSSMSSNDIIWPTPTTFSFGELVNFGYKNITNLIVPIKINNTKEGEYQLKGTLKWLVCKDICIPESIDFSLPVKVGKNKVYSKYQETIAQSINQSTYDIYEATLVKKNKNLILAIPIKTNQIGQQPYFYPEQPNSIDYSIKQVFQTTKTGLTITLSQLNNVKAISGIITFSDKDPIYIQTNNSQYLSYIKQLLLIVWLAFLGGILLNIMPCVLPILSIKVLAILDKSNQQQQIIRRQAKYYTGGVLTAFFIIATTLIVLKFIGLQLGWGFQLQSPLFVLSMFMVMIAVGLNFNNVFELPHWISTLTDKVSQKNYQLTTKSSYKDFFTGLLAVVLATPCTAPFMATALGFALTQSYLVMLFVFLALGFGFSFPFLIIAYIPVLQKCLPKPGNWMITFKHMLAVPIYLTALWLNWILVKQLGQSLWFLGAIIALNILSLGLINKFKIKYSKLLISMILIAITIITIHIFYLKPSTNYENSQQLDTLDSLIAQNQKVFVDVTAAWCVTCKVNEKLVLYTPEIVKLFKDNNIKFMTLDWTEYDADITDYLQSFNRVGVPLYVYYNKNGKATILPQVLTQKIVQNIIKSEGINE